MERKKIHLEYLLNATSKSILWADPYWFGGLVC